MKILLINGPNLNMLGKREPEIYGELSLDEIHQCMFKRSLELGIKLTVFQSNYEGGIVDSIHEALNKIDGIIINPAGYTHTSIAIRDALMLLKIPIIEVHISNIYSRESFRRTSVIGDIVNAHISGLGPKGYLLALEAISWLL